MAREWARQRWARSGAATAFVLSLLAASPSAGSAAVVPVKLTARAALVRVAPGVKMRAWTFNGQVPGPVIRVEQGDTVKVTLRNDHRGRAARARLVPAAAASGVIIAPIGSVLNQGAHKGAGPQ